MAEYRLAPIRPADVAVAAALHAQAGFSELWDERAFGTLLAMPGAAGRFIHKSDSPPVGLLLWRVAANEAEILTFMVVPDCRGQGAGQFLMKEFLSEIRAAGVRKVILEVATENRDAIALYRKLGFEDAGRRPSYYRSGSEAADALILTKDFLRK